MSLLAQFSDELERLVAQALPAVVGIEQGRGNGTGVVLTPDGYVLTNAHVVRSARRVHVRTSDGEETRGEVVGADPRTDLAVVRVEARGLPTLPLGEPQDVRIGQVVVAIGNPFQLEGSVSLGVVSAIDRSLHAPDGMQFEGLLQTDAAINPGNSGGPLLSVKGEVLGINTIVLPRAQGIGFAIPSSTARWVSAMLIQRGAVVRRYLGVAAKSEKAAVAKLQELGRQRIVRVLRVMQDSPADRAGLREGDAILAIDGQAVTSVDDLQRLMALATRDDMNVDFVRDGRRQGVHVFATTARAAA